jgi:hypothetical protein
MVIALGLVVVELVVVGITVARRGDRGQGAETPDR